MRSEMTVNGIEGGPSRASGTTLREPQGPPFVKYFDKLRDHPSTGSWTAQGPRHEFNE